jgi:ribosomal protein S27E
MVKNKELAEQQVNVRLTGLEYKALLVLGGPTAVIKLAIEREAGNKFKLKQLRQHIVDNIEKEQKQIQDIDKLIREYDEKAAETEEMRQKQEESKKKNETQIIKKPEPRLIFWNVGCPNCSTPQKMQMSASVRRCSGCGKMIKRDAWLKVEKTTRSPGEELKE